MTIGAVRSPDEIRATVRRFPWRAVALVVLVVLAYHYSLLTLARGLTLQTPLAYLALVPVIALCLAAARLRVDVPTLPIHDRQLDWIVGLALLGAAAAVLTLVPTTTDAGFWLRRGDLVTLPLFVAGLVVLLFGTRRAWSLRVPIAFLLLAWPLPYTMVLTGASSAFTDLTASTVAAVTSVVPMARPAVADPTLFYVGSGPSAFSVSISSACAGVNGFVGFLLVGTALLYLVRGPLLRRLTWLAVGLAVVFALNVLRIVVILAVGVTLGQAAAFDVLHPVAGLVVFNIGVIAMVALVPRFGLTYQASLSVTRRPPADARPPAGAGPSPVARVRTALVVAAALACVLGVTNASFARYDAISGGLGDARLTPFDVRGATIAGWRSRPLASFPMARQYFGATATWDRSIFWSEKQATLASTRSVYLDIVTTDDAGAFAAYSVDACYRFHGYRIESLTTVDIGAGVEAQIIDYHNTRVDADWSVLWWEWPIQDGDTTRYERVVLLLSEGPDTSFQGVDAAEVASESERFTTTDQFLVTLARELVGGQIAQAAP